MSLQSITNQIEARNRSVGSNPTPSELYHYSDLRSNSNTAVTKESQGASKPTTAQNQRDEINQLVSGLAKQKTAWLRGGDGQ